MRVAVVSTVSMSVELLLLPQMRALARAGYEVHAVAADGYGLEKARSEGFATHVIPFERELHPAKDLVAARALLELFRRERFDVVHSHTPKAGLLAPLTARMARIPAVVHTVHGLLFHDESPPHFAVAGYALEKWTATLAHLLLSQSQEDVDRAIRFRLAKPEAIEYVGNGINLTRFHPADEAERTRLRAGLGYASDDVVIGIAARLTREKGFLDFVPAVQKIMKENPRVKVLAIAPKDVDQWDALDPDKVFAPLPGERTTVLGFRKDVHELFRAMDMFVLPTYREGIPRTPMEASASSLPVITNHIRGCREVVLHGRTGLLVKPHDVEGLTAAIRRLALDPETRRSMGEQGREHVISTFDEELASERLLRIYETKVASLVSNRN